jgi:cytochrome c-type biogenesis protein CcmH/NrfG
VPRGAKLGLSAAVLLAGLVYVNGLSNPFVYDDHRLIVENRSLLDLKDLQAIVQHEVARPVLNLSYAVDRALWGPAPLGFHVTNVLLHVLNVGLLFVLAWRIVNDRRARGSSVAVKEPRPEVVAFAAAVLFGVHPMMTQAVGYVSGRSEVLCATFFLLALLSLRRWLISRTGRVEWLLLTIVLWILALASKEIAAMFPAVVLCYGLLAAPDPAQRRRMLWLCLPLLAVSVVVVAVRLAVLAWIEHPGQLAVHWRYGLVEMDVVRRYLMLVVLPRGQTIYHAIAPIDSLLDLRALLGLGTVSLLVGVAWWSRRAEGLVSFGLLWFLLLLVPSSGLVMLDRGEPMAEHRVYLASCGLFLAVGAAIGRLAIRMARARPHIRVAMGAVAVLSVLTLSAHTLLRNATWADPIVLWTEAVGKAPYSWLPRLLLAEALQDRGCREDVVVAYRNAIRLGPEEPTGYRKVGGCLIELGRLDEASAMFEALHNLDPRSPEASNGLGAIALVKGQTYLARRHFLQTLTLDPLNIPAHRMLAAIEEGAGNLSAALRLCEEVRQVAPETPGNDDCIRRNRARLDAIRSGGH